MIPIKAIRLSIGDLVAADVTYLAAVAAMKVALVKAAFAPSEDLTLAALTLATFTGSAPKAGTAGAQQVGIDPSTGDQKITILAPAGGWRFECTVAPGTAETIYGYALTDNAGAVLLGTALLDTPVPIAAVADFVDLGKIEITIVRAPMF